MGQGSVPEPEPDANMAFRWGGVKISSNDPVNLTGYNFKFGIKVKDPNPHMNLNVKDRLD